MLCIFNTCRFQPPYSCRFRRRYSSCCRYTVCCGTFSCVDYFIMIHINMVITTHLPNIKFQDMFLTNMFQV